MAPKRQGMRRASARGTSTPGVARTIIRESRSASSNRSKERAEREFVDFIRKRKEQGHVGDEPRVTTARTSGVVLDYLAEMTGLVSFRSCSQADTEPGDADVPAPPSLLSISDFNAFAHGLRLRFDEHGHMGAWCPPSHSIIKS